MLSKEILHCNSAYAYLVLEGKTKAKEGSCGLFELHTLTLPGTCDFPTPLPYAWLFQRHLVPNGSSCLPLKKRALGDNHLLACPLSCLSKALGCVWGDFESHSITVYISSADQNPEGVLVGLFCFASSKAVIISTDLRENLLALNTERDLWAWAVGRVWR